MLVDQIGAGGFGVAGKGVRVHDSQPAREPVGRRRGQLLRIVDARDELVARRGVLVVLAKRPHHRERQGPWRALVPGDEAQVHQRPLRRQARDDLWPLAVVSRRDRLHGREKRCVNFIGGGSLGCEELRPRI